MWLLSENALNNKQFFEINNHVFRIYGGNMQIKSQEYQQHQFSCSSMKMGVITIFTIVMTIIAITFCSF
jgi:hypothetical protein